jgi:hypothetical protein
METINNGVERVESSELPRDILAVAGGTVIWLVVLKGGAAYCCAASRYAAREQSRMMVNGI